LRGRWAGTDGHCGEHGWRIAVRCGGDRILGRRARLLLPLDCARAKDRVRQGTHGCSGDYAAPVVSDEAGQIKHTIAARISCCSDGHALLGWCAHDDSSLFVFSHIRWTIPVAAAQTYTATKIVFNHPGPYTQDQLEAAVGMHSGIKFNVDDLSASAQRLVDTGFFESVGPRWKRRAAQLPFCSTSSHSTARRCCTSASEISYGSATGRLRTLCAPNQPPYFLFLIISREQFAGGGLRRRADRRVGGEGDCSQSHTRDG